MLSMNKVANKKNDEEQQEDTRISVPLEAFKLALPYIVASLLIVLVGYWFIDPSPPKKVVISFSKYDGSYRTNAILYQILLKQEGVALEIRESEGPLQSLSELRKSDSSVDMAFFQDGIANSESSAGLVSLGSLYYEPLWIFYTKQHKVSHLSDLKGKRIAIGRAGSGTNILMKVLLDAAGVSSKNSKIIEIGDEDAGEALSRGDVDVAVISGIPTLPLIQHIANLPEVTIANLDDAEAYTRQFSFLHHLVLPEGALNLKTNVPSQAVNLLSPSITLVARNTMHPALVYLVLKVIQQIHKDAGILQHEHEFPADKDTDFELSSQAKKFYDSGVPFFDRYLPFWAANFVSRALIILIPLAALIIPLSRMAPSVYRWLIKSRIYKLYGELRYLEMQLRTTHPQIELETFRKELDAIEHRVNHLHLPVAFSSHLYELRSHIELVRSKLP